MFLNQVKGLSELLKTNLDKGINEDDSDLLKRRNAFGSNTYPRKKGRSFWVNFYLCFYFSFYFFSFFASPLVIFCSFFFLEICSYFVLILKYLIFSFVLWMRYPLLLLSCTQRFVWEACQDLTLMILMVAAVASLALGIKTEVSFFVYGWLGYVFIFTSRCCWVMVIMLLLFRVKISVYQLLMNFFIVLH